MKPAIKKTLIIVGALAVITVIVWYVATWKKSTNGIVSRLDLSKIDLQGETPENMRKRIRAQVEAVKGSFTRDEISHQASNDGLTYNQELVDWACYLLKQMGYLNQAAYSELSAQIKTL